MSFSIIIDLPREAASVSNEHLCAQNEVAGEFQLLMGRDQRTAFEERVPRPQSGESTGNDMATSSCVASEWQTSWSYSGPEQANNE
jgi:hypothetical protein